MYIPSTLIDVSDFVKTCQSISGNLFLFRIGIVGRLLTQLLFIIIPLLLYKLFIDQNKTAAFSMLVFALVSVPITMLSEALNIHLGYYLDTPGKVQWMIGLYHSIMNISHVFWGLWLLPLGYLVYHSAVFPKLIGICLYIGALGYLIGALTGILVPELEIFHSVGEIFTMGEMVFILWFVVRGKTKHRNIVTSQE
jgi:hypothetical protein